MKVFNDRQIFSLSLNRLKDSARVFSDLKVGDRISAGIVPGKGNSAELIVNGRRITAEFTGGVPGGAAVDLVLTEKTPDRIVFRIAGKQTIEDLARILSPLSILPDNKAAGVQLYKIGRAHV